MRNKVIEITVEVCLRGYDGSESRVALKEFVEVDHDSTSYHQTAEQAKLAFASLVLEARRGK